MNTDTVSINVKDAKDVPRMSDVYARYTVYLSANLSDVSKYKLDDGLYV